MSEAPPCSLDAVARAGRAGEHHDVHAGPRPRGLRGAAAVVGRRPRGVLGRRSGSTSASTAATTACSRSREMPGAQWFPGARGQLRRAHVPRASPTTGSAIRAASELRARRGWTWGELRSQTARIRAGLRRARRRARATASCAYLPNIPETVAAFLATASLGAIWSSAAPEFGARSVIDRFAQIEPKVLLAIDGYRYGGKDFDRTRDRRRDRGASRRRARWCGSATSTATRLGGRLPGPTDGAELDVRARAVRPPAVGALQLRHDRAAQGDRARPRRDPARAPQEDAPAPRRARRATASSGSPRPAG